MTNETMRHEARMLARRLSRAVAVAEANVYDHWGLLVPERVARARRLRRAWERSADRWRRRSGYQQIYQRAS